MPAARTRAEVVESAITTVRGVMADLDDASVRLQRAQQTLAAALVDFNASIEASDPD